jgi:hypothetical protein
MDIIFDRNPLNTKVTLDEVDKRILWHKIKIAELEERLGAAHMYLNPEATYHNVEKARAETDPDFWESEDGKSRLDEHCDSLLEYYVQELVGSHYGDCTCIPASCGKCHAEHMLGVNTIIGLGKHSAYKIDAAINSTRSVEEAIESLENYVPRVTNPEAWEKLGGWEQYAERWKAEATAAAAWLKQYRQNHIENYAKELS